MTPVRLRLSGAVAGGGKAALAAKALSAAGKVGRFVDPMTYIFKGAGFGLTKVGDAMAGLKGLGTIEIPPLPDNVFTLPEGAVRLPDGTIDIPAGATLPEGAVRRADGTVELPEGVIALPEGTVKNPFDEGAAYADLKGNLYDEKGNLVQRAEDARTEPGKTDTDANNPDHARVETPEMACVGARGGDSASGAIRMGDDRAPGAARVTVCRRGTRTCQVAVSTTLLATGSATPGQATAPGATPSRTPALRTPALAPATATPHQPTATAPTTRRFRIKVTTREALGRTATIPRPPKDRVGYPTTTLRAPLPVRGMRSRPPLKWARTETFHLQEVGRSSWSR